MDITLDDRSLQIPVQERTAFELLRLKEKSSDFWQTGQMQAARAPIRQPSHGHIKTKTKAENMLVTGYY